MQKESFGETLQNTKGSFDTQPCVFAGGNLLSLQVVAATTAVLLLRSNSYSQDRKAARPRERNEHLRICLEPPYARE